MNRNAILLEPEEAVLHADAQGYVHYQTKWGVAGFHIDTPYGKNGWWGKEFFRTEDGKVKTVLGEGEDAATLVLVPQATSVVERNEHIGDAAADHAFMLAANGTISPEAA